MLLLNYSEKPWGAPCSLLSPGASGGRLSGLHPSTLFKRADGSPAHFEGAVYYPAGGYGRIAARLAEECGAGTNRTGARVTRFLHAGNRIHSVEINGRGRLPVDGIVWLLDRPAVALGWIDTQSVTGRCVVRISNAYPVLTGDAERATEEIAAHLRRFSNLHLVGRNGLFQYGWVHTVLRGAKTLVEELGSDLGRRPELRTSNDRLSRHAE